MKAVRLAFLTSAVLSWAFVGIAGVHRSATSSKPRSLAWRADPTAASQSAAPISGSIGTFTAAGAPGPHAFAGKADVFLGVGSPTTPCQAFAFLPDEAYVLGVTDPSGATLLSTDPASERTFTVQKGVIASYSGTTHVVGAATACGSLTVGLAPFADAGPRRAGYVVWVTPLADFAGDPSMTDVSCGAGCFHGFRPEAALAVFFRVEDKAFCEATFCVSGTKFEDRNGNGLHDSGESGLPGVGIRVTSDSGVVFTGQTGTDGAFQICGIASTGAYRVSEVVPFGYTQTAPQDGTIAQRVFARGGAYILESCDRDISGLDFGNQLIPNAIGGVKYEDLNANGKRDPGEPGLVGVTIRLAPASGGTAQTTTTDASGNFLFTNVAPGSYVLSEVVPPGFTQTEPASATGTIDVTLASGGSSINNTFGNFRGILTGTISGVKFLDVNGNGVQDSGEPGQAGVTILLDECLSPCVHPPGPTTTTAADGSFSFTDVPFGTHVVSETVPAGFRQTAPAPPGTLTASLFLGQQSVTDLLFGNQAVSGTIAGTKFNDANANGVRDSGEAGIPGVTIQLAGPNGTASTTTDASGNFSFTGLDPGNYVVSEIVPMGFVQTTPGPPGTISVTLAAGQSVTNLLIGNAAAAATGSISGTKYLDLNINGVVDGIDRPLQGIVFVLTDANGVQRQATSDAHGQFSFTNLPSGTYTLNEILPPNFAQTFPGTPDHPTGYTITLTPGQNAAGYLFLNKC